MTSSDFDDDDAAPAESDKLSEPRGATLKLRELVEQVAAATGSKKSDVKRIIEGTLSAMGTALANKSNLVLPPLGRLRVAKEAAGVMTLKLRLVDPKPDPDLDPVDD